MSISIVFAGSDDLGVPALRALVNDKRFDVRFVISSAPKPVGRKQEMQLPPLGLEAERLGLNVKTPKDKNELLLLIEKEENPDFLVVVAYGMIVPQIVLDWPKVAAVNIHPSLLPKYRGASPIQSALLHGDAETGIGYMKMEAAMDAGPIYKMSVVKLSDDETAGQLFERLSEQAATELVDVLASINAGDIELMPQDGEVSYCGKIKKRDGELNLADLTAEDVMQRYRGYTPWPGVFWFEENGKRVIAREIANETRDLDLKPGALALEDDAVWLGTKNLAIKLLKVQPEGKNTMVATDWLRGRM